MVNYYKVKSLVLDRGQRHFELASLISAVGGPYVQPKLARIDL